MSWWQVNQQTTWTDIRPVMYFDVIWTSAGLWQIILFWNLWCVVEQSNYALFVFLFCFVFVFNTDRLNNNNWIIQHSINMGETWHLLHFWLHSNWHEPTSQWQFDFMGSAQIKIRMCTPTTQQQEGTVRHVLHTETTDCLWVQPLSRLQPPAVH